MRERREREKGEVCVREKGREGVYIYIYTERERERERSTKRGPYL
jgi:hypothetical protein